MKKKIALLILVALALTMGLSACTSTTPTKIIPRWTNGESYEYTVTLADFASKDSATHFNQYDHDSEKYYKDFVVRTGEPLDDMDEIRPKAVVGKFTLTITTHEINSIEYDVVETRQELKVTYEAKDGKIKVGDEQWVELAAELQSRAEKTSTSITLNSTTETMVEFKHDEHQAPVKSSTKVDGFYVGKSHQEFSKYEIATEYKYESKKTVAEIKLTQYKYDESKKTFTQETNELSDELKRKTEGTFIDSNQLFMYARSLDKSSTSFQDSPTVIAYNPFNQTTDTVNFYFTSSANAVLTNNGEELFAKLPTVGVVVGGMAFMLQESAPNLKEKLPDLFDEVGNGPDVAYYGGFPYAMHTPLRFRVGFLSFELAQYNDELWSALHPVVEEAEGAQ